MRVRKPKPIKDLSLSGLHFRSLGAAFMVESKQVQYAVHGHVRPVRPHGFVEGSCLARNDGGADHQFAEKMPAIWGDPGAVERQHIGRLVLMPVV